MAEGDFSLDLQAFDALPPAAGGGAGVDWGGLANLDFAPKGGGGFDWSRVGEGIKDFTAGAGSIAKAALPIMSAGAGVLGAVSSAQAASRASDQAKIAERAGKTQIAGAEGAQRVAPMIEPVISRIQSDVATPLTTFGKANLDAAMAGNISPAEQAEIDRWKQGRIAQLQSWFAHAGLGDSTMLGSMLAEVDKEAVAMKAARLDAAKQYGLAAEQAGGQALSSEIAGYGTEGNVFATSAGAAGQAAQTAQNEEAMLSNLIMAAQKALGELTGKQG